jgi:hypothetical protein
MSDIHSNPRRPLLGLTILIVDARRTYAEIFRVATLRTGARIRRADSLVSAQRHLRVYNPSVVLIADKLPGSTDAEFVAFIAEEQKNQLAEWPVHIIKHDDSVKTALNLFELVKKVVPGLATVDPASGLDDVIPPDLLAISDDLACFSEMNLCSDMESWVTWARASIKRDFPQELAASCVLMEQEA